MRKSSTIPKGKIIPRHSLRGRFAPNRDIPIRRYNPLYCTECQNHKRGKNWNLDFCKWSNKLCEPTRINGGMTIINCKGFKEKAKKETNGRINNLPSVAAGAN